MTPSVLLLDDDAAFRGLVRPALEARGLTVVEARKGREALHLLATTDLSVLVVDGLLPDTTGLRWIEKVRAEGVTLPIVFVSAFYRDLDSYKRLKEQLACADVLYKPLSPDDLAARVNALASSFEVDPRDRESRSSVLEIDLSEIETLLAEPEDEAMSEDVLLEPTYDTTQSNARSYEELRATYAESLPRLLDRAVRACAEARRRPSLGASVHEAIRHVHQIAGSAGSFGFDTIGAAAAILEDTLRGAEAHREVDWARFDTALEVLIHGAHGAPEVTDTSIVVPTSSRLLGPRLLVVDDDPALVDYLGGALAATLATFVPCESSAELEQLDLNGLEAAFVSMPFEGNEGCGRALALLRARRPDLPIAVLALEDSWEARHESMATGADLFLAHPVDDRELRRALLRLDTLRPASLRVSLLGTPELAPELTQHGVDARTHTSASSLLASFVRERPHVVVVGGHEALATIRTVRMADGGDDVALVARVDDDGTSSEGASLGAEALRAGADAVLSRGELRADVVQSFARRVAARRSRCLDVASGLPPRAELLDALHGKLNETRRRARAFTLAVLEIRDFDALVTREGTGLGERLLGAVGQLLATRFRLEDARGRWRGGVLVAGFAETDAATMAPAVRRFQAEVSQLAFHGDAERLKIAVDVALASAPVDGDDLRALLLSAEARLARASRASGGALVFG